ncbi:GNAT family N-acetyltransferase [Nocardioides aequoreus]|uniref:GNAT family N-acetyltransferase n=1 Tax=Nocardioides aequoreus TaxID=397278 RepID=UPI0004C2F4F7|nr:GNAT family N-acetyltransferase [Nocardioides aequoreus]
MPLVRAADLDRDVEPCRAIYAHYVEHTVVSFETEAPSAAEMRERMAAAVRSHAWLVAEDDGGEVVGYAYGAPHRARAAYRFLTEVSVYVAPGHERRGLGRALYDPLLGRLRQRGYRTAVAGMTLPNPGSQGLHASLGFSVIGTFRRAGWKHGAWRDTGWMELSLVDDPDGPPAELT